MNIYLPAFFVIIIDQATKMWIKNNLEIWESWDIVGSFLRFTHVKNQGLAFGIGVGDYKIFVTVLSIAATILIAYLHWQERNNHPMIMYGLSFILGGAIGNLIDRSNIFFSAAYSGVVDFIDVGTNGFRWYIFNIADSAVTIGIILYLLHSFFIVKPELLEKND